MGVEVQTLAPGDGQSFPKPGDQVTMHYTGKLKESGEVFDSSVNRGRPFVFRVGVGRMFWYRNKDNILTNIEVIKGWDEGVPQMSVGQKAVLTMTSDYGYGSQGFPGRIPPNSDLVFEVELLKVN